MARVHALLRRVQPATPTAPYTVVGNVRVYPARREVIVDGQEIVLPTKEFDLLLVLARRAGIVLTREMLLAKVWGDDFQGESRTVDKHIASLRTKIAASTVCIETVRSVGYKLVDDIERPISAPGKGE